MIMSQNKHIYSAEAQEILEKIPSWIIRWGVSVLAAIAGFAIVACCIIKYPDTITGTITLTTKTPPIDLVAKTNGNIEFIFFSEGDTIKKGSVVAVLESSTNWDDISFLVNKLDSAKLDPNILVGEPWIYEDYNLGELQLSFSDLQTKCADYLFYISENIYKHKAQLLNERIDKNKQYISSLHKQYPIYKEEVKIEHSNLSRDSLLLTQNAISEANYEQSVQSFKTKERNSQAFLSSIIAAELDLLNNMQQLEELSLNNKTEIMDYENKILESLKNFKSSSSQWMEKYVVTSPDDGIASFSTVWARGQYVSTGQRIVSIIPFGKAEIFGKIIVPSSRLGKVTVGQKVIVKLNGFPYMEYGALVGEVRVISAVPEMLSSLNDGATQGYAIDISFPNGLVTTYNEGLPLIQQMDGTADIVLKDKRLIEYFIEPIISVLNN